MGRSDLGTRGETAPLGAFISLPPTVFIEDPLGIQEIFGALRMRVPLENDPRSATDRPRTLSDIKNAVELLVRLDELVWRRSEHGADHGIFDARNILAVEEHIRLWERIARSP